MENPIRMCMYILASFPSRGEGKGKTGIPSFATYVKKHRNIFAAISMPPMR